jgi:hypothetical protein
MKSKKQGMTTLSVTESEMVAAVSAVQDMLYVMRVLESIELKEQLPMVLEVDNKGVVDLAINWSVGERTHHISIRVNFLRELKEQGLLHVMWIPTDENSADLCTKNLPGPLFEKHVNVFIGNDSDDLSNSSDSQGESVGGQMYRTD